jgi:toxin YhaV
VATIRTGWQLFYFKVFKAALDELERTVSTLAKRDPTGYKAHPKTRLLASVYEYGHVSRRISGAL